MSTKAQITSDYIIKTVAPVFNRKGYSGTSISDITTITGLTKGAIYGNFKDKNALAVSAFVYNIKLVSNKLEEALGNKKTSVEKLYALANFYNDYYEFTYKFGGCPILNIGIDANHQNEELMQKVKKAIHNIQSNLALIIEQGIFTGELKENISSKKYARKMFSMVEGAIFMATMLKDKTYMNDLQESLLDLVDTELKK